MRSKSAGTRQAPPDVTRFEGADPVEDGGGCHESFGQIARLVAGRATSSDAMRGNADVHVVSAGLKMASFHFDAFSV